jgi:hypothetical protein
MCFHISFYMYIYILIYCFEKIKFMCNELTMRQFSCANIFFYSLITHKVVNQFAFILQIIIY